MPFARRAFLRSAAALAVSPVLFGSRGTGSLPGRDTPFRHGVASGDPGHDSVLLWTRITPLARPSDIEVHFVVAEDPDLSRIVTGGVAFARSRADFTVKVEAKGLLPGRTYYYRFAALGHRSPIGRTRTLPRGRLARLRLAVASCSSYPHGLFNGYRAIAARADLDAVLHLGDYLYEYENGRFGDGTALGRVPDPNRELVTLADYRRRHAQYKSDPDLQEAHRQHPFIAVWDDHEIANNAYRNGAENHQPWSEGSFRARRTAALRAYLEWMPVRATGSGGRVRAYRSFSFGDLADLVMLDTRIAGRDAPVDDRCAVRLASEKRHLLGPEQERWLFQRLLRSEQRGARFRLIGQQVPFAPLLDPANEDGCPLDVDGWDGYPQSRERLVRMLRERHVDSVLVLTGDAHSSWANDVALDPYDVRAYDPETGRGSRAVEIVTPGITSPGVSDARRAAALATAYRRTHPHVRFVELHRRGYVILDVTHERAQAEWYHLSTVLEPSDEETLAAVFRVEPRANRLAPGADASLPDPEAPPLAPRHDPMG
ncbi:MAG: alkaline phosphatase D family protein [Pseudomonadota bacterium]